MTCIPACCIEVRLTRAICIYHTIYVAISRRWMMAIYRFVHKSMLSVFHRATHVSICPGRYTTCGPLYVFLSDAVYGCLTHYRSVVFPLLDRVSGTLCLLHYVTLRNKDISLVQFKRLLKTLWFV